MSFAADIPQNINIVPIPVEKVVETPKPEAGKNDIDHSALELKNQKTEDEKRIKSEDSRKKRKGKQDTYSPKDSSSDETNDNQLKDNKNHLVYDKNEKQISQEFDSDHILDVVV